MEKTEEKTGKINAACMRYGIGRNKMRELAEEAGAVVRIGRLYLVNYSVMDEFMDARTKTESERRADYGTEQSGASL